MSEAFRISGQDLRWYAAFHNEGHHPHVHVLVYSEGREGYLGREDIRKLKSELTREVFKDELSFLYEEKTKQRKSVKEKAGEELLKAMAGLSQGGYKDTMIEVKMRMLGQRLSGIKGKKVYGYLHKDIKAMVDDIFQDLEKIPEVKECYDKWLDWLEKITGYYQDKEAPKIPMSENPEFRSVKNAVIREAIRISQEGGISYGVKQSETGNASRDENGTMEKTSRADQTQAASSALYASHQALRMLKYLEKIFQGKMEKTTLGRKMVAESKDVQREMERRAALGQKDGGSEDITQSL
ncbi:MAG: hypothetical protein E7295_12510 [Lachnospiraceae bacterium]|nr:hypothetical protein [Lachnospiraceae bacterium]